MQATKHAVKDEVVIVDKGAGGFDIGTVGIVVAKFPKCYKIAAEGDHWFYSDEHLEAHPPQKFNKQQTEWRENMVMYLVSTESFREDFHEGKITEEMLKSFGVTVTPNRESGFDFFLIEE